MAHDDEGEKRRKERRANREQTAAGIVTILSLYIYMYATTDISRDGVPTPMANQLSRLSKTNLHLFDDRRLKLRERGKNNSTSNYRNITKVNTYYEGVRV